MLLWLGEASGVDVRLVEKAAVVALRTRGTFSAKCGVIRKIITWDVLRAELDA
jgi:hypothetical protein